MSMFGVGDNRGRFLNGDDLPTGTCFRRRGRDYVVMGYTDWPSVGREFYIVSEATGEAETAYGVFENEVKRV